MIAKHSRFLHSDSDDLSDWADAQAEPSLRWAHRSFCWFYHVLAHYFCFIAGCKLRRLETEESR